MCRPSQTPHLTLSSTRIKQATPCNRCQLGTTEVTPSTHFSNQKRDPVKGPSPPHRISKKTMRVVVFHCCYPTEEAPPTYTTPGCCLCTGTSSRGCWLQVEHGNVYVCIVCILGDACDSPGKSCLFFLTVPTVCTALEAVYLERGLEVG